MATQTDYLGLLLLDKEKPSVVGDGRDDGSAVHCLPEHAARQLEQAVTSATLRPTTDSRRRSSCATSCRCWRWPPALPPALPPRLGIPPPYSALNGEPHAPNYEPHAPIFELHAPIFEPHAPNGEPKKSGGSRLGAPNFKMQNGS